MKKLISGFLLLLFIGTSVHMVFAEEDQNGPPIAVEPIYPNNQVEGIKGYFRLKVQPKQKQTIHVRLRNNKSQQQKVIIKAANGYTNPVGGMLYSEEMDSSNSVLLEGNIQLAPNLDVESEVILGPSETREIPITLTVPSIEKGTLLGAVRFITEGKPQEETVEAEEGEANFVLKTETVYAIAIQLDLPGKVDPNFSIGEAGFMLEGPSVYSEFLNQTQMIQEGISGEYQVEDSDGNQLFEGKIEEFKMAPQTKIRYPIPWNYESLEPGEYKLYVKMNVNNNEIASQQNFRVGNEEINEYVERTQPVVPSAQATGIPSWVWIIGGLCLAAIMFWLGKRKSTRK